MKTNRPRGFTLVELLVVITIIGMLMALLIPAIGAARGAARKAQCNNNMRQVAQALAAYQSRHQNLPGRINEVSVRSGTQTAVTPASWVATILPELERSDIWDRIRAGEMGPGTQADLIPRLDIVICPSDVQASAAIPGLSFVGNSGHWDVANNDNPVGDYPENGIFFGRVLANGTVVPGPKVGFDQIRDGVATTMLISENIQAGPPDSPTGSDEAPNSWMLSLTERGDGFVWLNDPTSQARINQEKDQFASYDNPTFCRPSSNHPDGVNLAFCDGHIEFIRDNIEYYVYQQLMTSNGSKAKVPPSGEPANATFRAYVLNAKDYR